MAFKEITAEDGTKFQAPKKYEELSEAEKRGAKWGSLMTRNDIKRKLGLKKVDK